MLIHQSTRHPAQKYEQPTPPAARTRESAEPSSAASTSGRALHPWLRASALLSLPHPKAIAWLTISSMLALILSSVAGLPAWIVALASLPLVASVVCAYAIDRVELAPFGSMAPPRDETFDVEAHMQALRAGRADNDAWLSDPTMPMTRRVGRG